MQIRLNILAKFYCTAFICGFIFNTPISSFAKAKQSAPRAESCLKLGQGDTLSGVPQTDSKLPTHCCKSLKDRESKDLCGIPSGGGYQYVCIACGDGKCDPELENTCNCHEDCK